MESVTVVQKGLFLSFAFDINTNPNPKHNFNWQTENSLEQIELSVRKI